MFTSAAALDIGRPPATTSEAHAGLTRVARTREAARAEQRERIEQRYLAERGRCASLGGFQRDKCLVKAHANKGRAMLEAAAPYEVRF